MALAAIERLAHHIATLPGIGERSAFRLAMHLFYSEPTSRAQFAEALSSLTDGITLCPRCHNLTDSGGLCEICRDASRDSKTICVVEEYIDLISIEETHEYNGSYHVLHGLIEPMKGVGVNDIKLTELIARVGSEPIEELIIAFDAGLPGDTTANYIAKQVAETGVRISRIAYGLSLGSDIEHADSRTLARSIAGRTPL